MSFLYWVHNAIRNLIVFGALIVSVPVFLIALVSPQGMLSPDRYLDGETVTILVIAQNGIPVEDFEIFIIKTQMTDRYGNRYDSWNGRNCTTGADGSCSIDHLPPGEYAITEMTGNAGLEKYYAASFFPDKFTLEGPSQVNIKATMVQR